MAEQASVEKIALVFDWGNTLMKVFPQYTGPMAAWPEVAEVDGVVEALEALLGSYPMVVATNAGDSNVEQVWKAFRRVGLGAKKPDPVFFRSLESVLARPPHQLVMVGDDFRADVLGAKTAGWRAVWYNPGWQAAPALLPLHDAEVHDLRELPQVLARPALPDYPTCLAWLLSRGTPYNILAHVGLVAAVAYQMAVWLGAAGLPVDPLLTHRGAMLHDLAKIDSIRLNKERGEHGDHARMASDLLLERGQSELAEIANRHMPYQDPTDPRRPLTWEQKLVHFADKMAEGSHLVPIEERVQALKARYPSYAGELEQSLPILTAMQNEICAQLNLTPAELVARLREALLIK